MKAKKTLLMYGSIFTIINIIGLYLIVENINWIWIVTYLLMIGLALFLLFVDSYEPYDERIQKMFYEDNNTVPTIILLFAIFASISLDKFIPQSFQTKKIFEDNLPSIAIFISLACILIILKRDFKYKRTFKENENKLEQTRQQLDQILENTKQVNEKLVKYNPLYSTEYTFKDVIDRLHIISAPKIALEFSVKSLNNIAKYGFLKIDVSFAEYTRYLYRTIENSRKSIIGSFTFRPKVIYEDIKNTPNETDNNRLEYVKKINSKDYETKIRIVILSISEIEQILDDAKNSMINNYPTLIHEIPEIKWFTDKFSKKFQVFWTTREFFYEHYINNESEEIKHLISLPNHSISDFAIFDSDLFITWRKNMENIHDLSEYGTLLLSWNIHVNRFSDYFTNGKSFNIPNHMYSKFLSLVYTLRKTNPKINELITDIEKMKEDGLGWDSRNYGLI